MAWWLAQAREAEPELRTEHVLPFLDHGYGILLFDGLDEVGSAERRTKVLRWLDHRWVCSTPRGTSNLTVVTARPSGFEGIDDADMPNGELLHVAPFSIDQIRAFLTRWFDLRPLSPTRRKESVESLISRLVEDDRMTSLRALSRRPAYLASLAFVHGTRGALPIRAPRCMNRSWTPTSTCSTGSAASWRGTGTGRRSARCSRPWHTRRTWGPLPRIMRMKTGGFAWSRAELERR